MPPPKRRVLICSVIAILLVVALALTPLLFVPPTHREKQQQRLPRKNALSNSDGFATATQISRATTVTATALAPAATTASTTITRPRFVQPLVNIAISSVAIRPPRSAVEVPRGMLPAQQRLNQLRFFSATLNASRKNKQHYASLHGYDFFLLEQCDSDHAAPEQQSPEFAKIKLLLKVLNEPKRLDSGAVVNPHDEDEKHYHWVLLMDADAAFTNMSISVEDFIVEQLHDVKEVTRSALDLPPTSADLFMARDAIIGDRNSVNSGVMLVRNCAFVRNFFNSVLHFPRDCSPGQMFEQDTINCLLNENGPRRDDATVNRWHLRTVQQSESGFNSFPAPFDRGVAGASHRPGHWIGHTAGATGTGLLSMYKAVDVFKKMVQAAATTGDPEREKNLPADEEDRALRIVCSV